jgi:hypothetical protein
MRNFLNPQQQKQNFGATKSDHGKKLIVQWKLIQLNSTGNLSPFKNYLLIASANSNLGTRFFLRGVGCDAPGF